LYVICNVSVKLLKARTREPAEEVARDTEEVASDTEGVASDTEEMASDVGITQRVWG
jgi:hypothetical protein